MRKLGELRKDNSGSVVLVAVFIITLAAFGFIYTLVNFAVQVIIAASTTASVTFLFLVWFWDYGLILVVLILSTTWLVSQLQKSRYREA